MKLIALLLFFFTFSVVYSQDSIPQIQMVDQPVKETIWIDAFHPNGCMCGPEAMFPGGSAALQKYVDAHFKPPLIPNREYKYNKIYTRFTVNEDGTLSDIRVERGICSELDNAAIEMLQSMPKWIPTSNSCQEFKTDCRLPISVSIK